MSHRILWESFLRDSICDSIMIVSGFKVVVVVVVVVMVMVVATAVVHNMIYHDCTYIGVKVPV